MLRRKAEVGRRIWVTVVLCAALGLANIGLAQSSDVEVVDVRELMPDVSIDARYSMSGNFVGPKLYAADRHTAYGTIGAIKDLRRVRSDLNAEGFDIKIWDFYRPLAIQWVMFEAFPDPTFVADPRNGSNHNRAAAVDVTLVDRETSEELDMGTDFDDFSQAAHHGNSDLPLDVRQRRFRLSVNMDNHGFSSYFAEWWHYTHGASSSSVPLLEYQMK